MPSQMNIWIRRSFLAVFPLLVILLLYEVNYSRKYEDVVIEIATELPVGTEKWAVLKFMAGNENVLREPQIVSVMNEGTSSYMIVFDTKKLARQWCALGLGGDEDKIIFYFDSLDKLTEFHIRTSCKVAPYSSQTGSIN